MARWVYGYRGEGNRVPLAACIVNKIRKGYPPPEVESGEQTVLTHIGFTGFQEAAVDEEEEPMQRDDEH